MERLLARLERRFGRYAPGNLAYVLVAAQVVGFMLGVTTPGSLDQLTFDVDRIAAGEVWRVVSWLAMPPSLSPIWALFALYWLYVMGTSLEAEWGAFKFLVYWLVGLLATVGAAWAVHRPATNGPFLMTLFLAFATLWPDYEIRVFLVLPVKVKWLAYLDGIYLVYHTATLDGLEMLLPAVSVANYLLFFGATLWGRVRGYGRQAARAGARSRMRASVAEAALPSVRRCAICGASNDNPDVEIRVCDCEKCGGVMRDLCLPHARNH